MMMRMYETYMRRCLELAALGAGSVAPNPMVGAVLVYGDLIVGEGYHLKYGQAHAEVNCIRDCEQQFGAGHFAHLGFVAVGELLRQCTMYVSLEPCAHYGKTPPCADLIIAMQIPRVVVGIRDPFEAVDGKGIDKLRKAGIEVTMPVLEEECYVLNRRFFTFHTQHRPYIVLKWAQSADAKIGVAGERIQISNDWSNRLVHRWRSEEAGILVGTNTALTDDPSLTNRLWSGGHPVRLLVDTGLRLPAHLRLFDRQVRTIVFNLHREEELENLQYYRLAEGGSLVQQLAQALYELKIQSVLVEGGTRLLQSFIDAGLWDEARVVTNRSMLIGEGVDAPVLPGVVKAETDELLNDSVLTCYREMQPLH